MIRAKQRDRYLAANAKVKRLMAELARANTAEDKAILARRIEKARAAVSRARACYGIGLGLDAEMGED